jgi:site-specific DNA recombinase
MKKPTTSARGIVALAGPKLVRCAVYTRKSTEEGLEQEFNSLDAQREAGEAYVKSQAARDGFSCPTATTTAGIPAATPTGRPSNA